jgi:hypothetical protein
MSEDSGQPQPPTDPQTPQYPTPQYPTPQYPTQQYPANPYGATPPYPPGYPQFPVYVRPDLPKATAALVVGIVSVAGLFTCVLPILAAPVAWILGVQARREIRNAPQQWGGDSKATAGMVLGIIGTVLLTLLILGVILLIVVAANDSTAFDSDTGV